jgi:nitrogen-specific signal transduction histidine kinase
MPSFACWTAQNGPISATAGSQARLGRSLALSMAGQEGTNMALSKEGLIQELKHEIHSPLAAIRNALYLAGVRTDNPEALRYLALAEAEITRIAAVLKNADQIEENKQVHVLIPLMGKALAV